MESLSELEEMQHVLHFLDTSLITSPSGSDLAAQKKRNESQRHRREYQQHHTPPDQLRDMAKLPENEERSSCNEIGEVIELLGSLEANDTPNQEMQHQKQQHEHQEALCGGNISCGLSRSTAFSDGVSQMAQPPQSAIPSYNQSVAENISPAGLLNGSSMSPSTINWLQALVPSTSSESLTSLISPATLYSAGSNSASGIEEVTELLSVIESSQTDDTTMTKSDGLTRCGRRPAK
ncbi:uncharacterized protein PHALS_11582 [Plasmopara halstedii]|uniref:Uncharacterized protein n=1 Tax=Plasmopara halstedii TaxID=4781 RepID=A0A0P1AK66_PLAHL|nr:uncharacterized protein PHALS_11582 [Plasmopara halstedii]CEG41220.1 hypothetical protein PHALS_11582 [Plasmopara halstedii]|eukprot:XP_024577589.1 hypothetical protein PHALS_11582 [Plasmopara halstedii]